LVAVQNSSAAPELVFTNISPTPHVDGVVAPNRTGDVVDAPVRFTAPDHASVEVGSTAHPPPEIVVRFVPQESVIANASARKSVGAENTPLVITTVPAT
jgi:hypothetical protein